VNGLLSKPTGSQTAGFGRTGLKLVTAVLVSLAVVEAAVLFSIVQAPGDWSLGMDYRFYRDIGMRWLREGTYYLPHQLAGPYDVRLMTDVLYPPYGLLLFVPLAVLPALVWWIVPVGVLMLAWRWWRPAPWTWPVVVLLFMWPRSMATFLYGNTDMWIAAGVAGGLLFGLPAALVLLKPTLAPLALVGVRHRSWWTIPIALMLSFVAMASMWTDYLTVLRNVRIGWDYSLGSLPLVSLPLVLWLGRRTIPSTDVDRYPES
jgi:hypothetical protein